MMRLEYYKEKRQQLEKNKNKSKNKKTRSVMIFTGLLLRALVIVTDVPHLFFSPVYYYCS